MNVKGYKYSQDNSHLVYTFHSIGKHGTITKVVVYEEVTENLYNVAFGGMKKNPSLTLPSEQDILAKIKQKYGEKPVFSQKYQEAVKSFELHGLVSQTFEK